MGYMLWCSSKLRCRPRPPKEKRKQAYGIKGMLFEGPQITPRPSGTSGEKRASTAVGQRITSHGCLRTASALRITGSRYLKVVGGDSLAGFQQPVGGLRVVIRGFCTTSSI
ncbi:hypothetical protein NDU88_001816 [Pleurodeles waltl]|uniref:Uncharacterized protein n=1 Tax=Pleurodeles waltl TaxID=8319 RepID=A0AAV7NEH6_PLEWA|nr:hypothetical protein NDU88_001816 [Pleurodeles waltl]